MFFLPIITYYLFYDCAKSDIVVLKGGGLISEEAAVYSAMGALFWLCDLFKARRL